MPVFLQWIQPLLVLVLTLAICPIGSLAQPDAPTTQALTAQGDFSVQMVAGIDKFLMRQISESVQARPMLWQRDFSSAEAYNKSVTPNRERLRKYLGAVDPRLPVTALEYMHGSDTPEVLAETSTYSVRPVRWKVFDGVFAEGLWLRPKRQALAHVIALSDADQTPEMLCGLTSGIPPRSQFAKRLAEADCEVLVPVLIDRQDTWSGNEKLKRFTNQPHREWIYRQSFEMGRHIIGYEVQKVLAGVDWFSRAPARSDQRDADGKSPLASPRIALVGYGEGGLLALYAAALDSRVAATVVSGYFDAREQVWAEPIYRNIFGLLHEFGDAEVASLITPRKLIVEHSKAPEVPGPPQPREGRGGAAPGRISTTDFLSVESEILRANGLVQRLASKLPIDLVTGSEGITVNPGSERALVLLLNSVGVKLKQLPPSETLTVHASLASPAERQRRQVKELEQFTQKLWRDSERTRDSSLWSKLKGTSREEWNKVCSTNRANLWEQVIGRFQLTNSPINPRSRKIYDKARWTGYEVMLDVYPDIFAWGYLLIPKDLREGERRPVVVCQHGLEGLPADVVDDDPQSKGFGPYRGYATRLVERGFVVYAPHNPYRGQDKFRVLQRKANPIKKSLFSVIIAQHEVALTWLCGLPFVDPERVGFYGLSYGGKTAMRVPAVLERYALSICSADFNEWIQKNVTVDSSYSYLYTGEYEMPEFDLGHTFNYAEMAMLIAPRPFMVERGHHDGVAPDNWVAYEYAKVRRGYVQLGIPERTEIEFFNGPHTINGQGTFRFLHRHLNWPERQE